MNKEKKGNLKCFLVGHKKSNVTKSYLWNSIEFTCERCGKKWIN